MHFSLRSPTHTTAYYEARIAFGLSSALPLLMLPAYAFFGWLSWASREAVPSFEEISRAFEVALPLTAGLLSAHLMNIEREEGFDELRRSTQEKSWRLPLLRTSGAITYTLIAALVAAALFRLAGGDFMLADVLIPALPPTLVLLGLSLLMGNLSGNYWASAGAVIAHWTLDLYMMGRVSQTLFLFDASFPLPEVNYDLNRLLLTALGILLLGLNVAFSAWRRRRGGGR
jgi:hypothetical protein